MRWTLLLALGLIATFPLFADPSADNSSQTFTLISVSHPGCSVTEVHSLCSVSPSGTPLRLTLVQGNADPKLVSLESVDNPGYFLRHQDSRLKLHPYAENDWVFSNDSTFQLVRNADGTVSFRSYNYPTQYISVTANNALCISTDPEAPSRSFTLGK